MEIPEDDRDDRKFWMHVSAFSMARIWGNLEDDVYAELLHNSASNEDQSVRTEGAVSGRKEKADIDQAAER